MVWGHRGASFEAPENTLAAFELARAQGADGIELDVQRCASGEVVVLHDESLGRTTGFAGLVAETRWAFLKTLDAGARKQARFSGERVLFGEGVAPWKEILATAESVGGVEYYLLEQEGSRYSEFETAKRCLASWKKLTRRK